MGQKGQNRGRFGAEMAEINAKAKQTVSQLWRRGRWGRRGSWGSKIEKCISQKPGQHLPKTPETLLLRTNRAKPVAITTTPAR